ncbi:MAG: NAD(P)H-dependent oxidoreductase [Rhodobacteraceae bacterium]|nr:NAD(P)H-dependent oxidoreductase [Paracoccaceae bacterium]
MRALVVYCHPRPESFTAAVRDVVLDRLGQAGAEVRLTDLYARGFDPVLSAAEHAGYLDSPANRAPVARDCDDLAWADTLIFVYPTWWYGLPAVLKGWLDRVMLPDVAFLMPKGPGETIRPGLTHITRLGVFTTCGASRLLTFLVGAPGKRTLMRGVGFLCAPRCRKVFAAHYLMDSSTPESRARHLDRVARRMDRLIGPLPARQEQPA